MRCPESGTLVPVIFCVKTVVTQSFAKPISNHSVYVTERRSYPLPLPGEQQPRSPKGLWTQVPVSGILQV